MSREINHKILTKTLRQKPRKQFFFAERVHPNIVTDARVFAVFYVSLIGFESFSNPARFADGNNPVVRTVKKPRRSFADFLRDSRKSVAVSQGTSAAD